MSSTRISLAWTVSQRLIQYGLQLIGSMVIARLLTPDELGIFALAMAASFIVSSLRDFGVGSYLVREEELTEDKIRTAFGMWLAVSWGIGLILLLSRHLIAGVYDEPRIAEVLTLVSISFFITPFGQPAQSLLTREMRFDILHHIALVCALLGVTTNIVLSYLGFGYKTLAWGMVISNAANALLLIVVRRSHLKLLPSFHHWRSVMQFGGFLTGASLLGTLQTEGTKFFLGGALNPASLAQYDRSTQLPSMARQAIFSPLSRVLFPAFSKDIREGRAIEPAVEKLVIGTTMLIWPMFLTFGILAVPLITLLFGDNWRVAGEILPFILLGQAIIAMMPQPEQILVPHGKASRLFYLRAGITGVGLTLVATTGWMGLRFFAMARVLYEIIAVILIFLAIRPFLKLNWPSIMGNHAKAIATAVISSTPALAMKLQYGEAMLFTAFVFVALASPPIWLACLFVFRHPLAGEIRDIIGLARKKITKWRQPAHTTDDSV